MKKIWEWVIGPPLPAPGAVLPPSPGAAGCMARINAGSLQAREANEAQQNRTTVLFYGIERPCFFLQAGALSI
jgi:hypothetical protein